MTHQTLPHVSDWGVCLNGYMQEEVRPFKWYAKQKLLVIKKNFLWSVWEMGTTEPLTLDNLDRAALHVARLGFPDAKKVRVAFDETFYVPGYIPRRWY